MSIQLNPKKISEILDHTHKRMDKADDTMRLVILVLLFMLGGIVITTFLWVAQSFIAMRKPEIIYNINVPVEDIQNTINELPNIQK